MLLTYGDVRKECIIKTHKKGMKEIFIHYNHWEDALKDFELLKQISEIRFSNPIIMISGHGDIETAVQTLKLGAYDYIEKPLDLNRVLTSVKNAFDNSSLKKENILFDEIIFEFMSLGEDL